MANHAGWVVFGLGNPVEGIGGRGGGVQNLAICQESRWLIYSTLHFKYTGFSFQVNFLILFPVIIFCKNVTHPRKRILCNWGCYTLCKNESPVQNVISYARITCLLFFIVRSPCDHICRKPGNTPCQLTQSFDYKHPFFF